VDRRSFRDQLASSIGFALTRSRGLLRRILTEHAADDARQQLAARVVQPLEQSGFELDEAEQVMRSARRPGTTGRRLGLELLELGLGPASIVRRQGSPQLKPGSAGREFGLGFEPRRRRCGGQAASSL
jgi:hypothetical protein